MLSLPTASVSSFILLRMMHELKQTIECASSDCHYLFEFCVRGGAEMVGTCKFQVMGNLIKQDQSCHGGIAYHADGVYLQPHCTGECGKE